MVPRANKYFFFTFSIMLVLFTTRISFGFHRRIILEKYHFISASTRNSNSGSFNLYSNSKKVDNSVRINKCLPSLSRRAADDVINEGRVTINGKIAKCGDRVEPRDVVKLDGKMQRWEILSRAKALEPAQKLENRDLIYLKYWKPRGVTCTSDTRDETNIITAGRFDLFPQRVFSVGRLDKDSTGLILLTSDGRVNAAMLNPQTKREKTYEVTLNKV